jgi:hypothetical protein
VTPVGIGPTAADHRSAPLASAFATA